MSETAPSEHDAGRTHSPCNVSETVPEGSTIEFTVVLILEKEPAKKGAEAIDHEQALIEWLDYGKFKGFGQWRNSSKGRFRYEIIS